MPDHKIFYDVLADGDLDVFFNSSPDDHGFSKSQIKSFLTLRARYLELQSIFLKGQMANEEWLREFSRIHEACVHLVQEHKEQPPAPKQSFIKTYAAIIGGLALLFFIANNYLKHNTSIKSVDTKSSQNSAVSEKELENTNGPKIKIIHSPRSNEDTNREATMRDAAFTLTTKGLPLDLQEVIHAYMEETLFEKGLSLTSSNSDANKSGKIECTYQIDKKQTTSGVRTDASSLLVHFSIKMTTIDERICLQKTFQSEEYIVYPDDEEREIVAAYLHSIRPELKALNTQNCR